MHRAEQVMAALTAALTGLTTTGDNVKRGRADDDDFLDDIDSALSIYQGGEIPEQNSWPLLSCDLTVYIDIHVKKNAVVMDTDLNKIRVEITKALMSSNNLNLLFVADITEGATSEPQTTEQSEKRSSVVRTSYTVQYSRNYADPEN